MIARKWNKVHLNWHFLITHDICSTIHKELEGAKSKKKVKIKSENMVSSVFCKKCNRSVGHSSQRHNLQVHRFCEPCYQSFNTEVDLYDHLEKNHTDIKVYQCSNGKFLLPQGYCKMFE